MKRILIVWGAGIAVVVAAVVALSGASSPAAQALPSPQPTVSDYQFISASETPPTETQCFNATPVKRRCFTPASLRSAYNMQPLYDAGFDGTGVTIAIVDSWGSDTIRHDLHVYDQAWGLPPMCGEESVTCAAGMPKFDVFYPNGSPSTTSSGQGTGQEDKTAWALEVSLDVELVHTVAPGANILLVATTGAETLGVQGFPNMMKAEKDLIEGHKVQVISQSFASAEEAFGSAQSLENLRDAFKAAAANGVTVLGSSGDGGTANGTKQPVGQGGALIPFPTVEWPASDPLVTGVGGTYLCTDPLATASQPRTVDSADPPTNCQSNPGVAEVGWIASGGGFSHVFSKPTYQGTLPAGSTPIDTARGVPDIASQASARTGALIYISLPPDGQSGLLCGSSPCSTGWYDIGGTSLACPEWAGLVGIADQINGGNGLGLINPALYALASNPTSYANDFYDVTTGNNQAVSTIPGYPATTGWDPVTGLGTPNAANLLPDLVAAVNNP
jgi:subtilase family serine protease